VSSASLLIELGCEELPAAACRAADAQAGDVVARLLRERRLAPAAVEVLVSPRRIAVLAHGVPDRQVAERVEHRGPPERVARDGDGWTRAALGFARRHGLGPEALELRDGFTWVSLDATTAALDAVVGDVVDGLIEGLQLPKNMRWGSETLRFARPIRTLAVLHGERVLDASVAGVSAGRTVRGHRLVARTVDVEAAERYVATLGSAGVLVPSAARREAIVAQLDAAADRLGLRWTDPGDVLDEVVFLVERPHVVEGRFAEDHLELPDEVLVTAMQSHQRYLPLERDGARHPGFLTVVNSDPAHDAVVRAGNERVLDGRLEDAAFSFRQDAERGIEAMAASLDRVTFHARAGSLADKTVRLRALVEALAAMAGAEDADREAAVRAAELAKADQASVMVAEFAELEGAIGERYARAAGLPEPVARAIGEQFLPVRADGRPPGTAPARSWPPPTSSTRSPRCTRWASSRRARGTPTRCAARQPAS
jgi:glycyl-tRNA synthetase beta chain